MPLVKRQNVVAIKCNRCRLQPGLCVFASCATWNNFNDQVRMAFYTCITKVTWLILSEFTK